MLAAAICRDPFPVMGHPELWQHEFESLFSTWPSAEIANDFSLEMGGANMVLVLVAVSSFQ